MSDKITLKVSKRKITGSKVKKLRKEGLLPANVYGKDVKSLAVELTIKDFLDVLKKAGETSIIELTIDKEAKTRPVLIKNPQLHPVTDEYLHVDFRQVDLTKKISVKVPIILTGIAPATNKGGILLQVLDEIEVEALPTDLPDKFEIDIKGLEEIGQNITLKDIKVGAKVKLVTDDLEALIVKIEEPTKEKEEVPVETEEEVVEGEEGEEGEVKEGEEPKEGEKGEAKEGEEKKEDGKPEGKPDSAKGGKPAPKKEEPKK